MYYVLNKRNGIVKTIGEAVTITEAKYVIKREKSRMERNGIVKIGEFEVQKNKYDSQRIKAKNSRNTWNKKEFCEEFVEFTPMNKRRIVTNSRVTGTRSEY